ncbi:hypothetical protein ACIGCK_01615 [Microbacterium sp. NPDC078428]|uniref:hypothetical protein n=1 Tax=Microbacterium sp. NPDC078428 TaxID=3364190 RepID=UPI0037CBEA14
MRPATVVLPWRPAPSRLEAYDRVRGWYARMLPELTVTTIDSPDPVFNLALCRNLAVESLAEPDDVVVLGDADTIPEPAPLRAAIEAARTSGRVHLPYTAYHWLGAEGSAQFAAGIAPEDCRFELVRGACSGVYVTTRRTWESHGGQDPRFRGWGYEDAAWQLAHTTLVGAPPQRHEGRVYALHHVAETRAGAQYDANAALMERYRTASEDASAMRALVSER